MTTLRLPSGLAHGLDVLVDANWTPEQATGVFELLDDLCDQIGSTFASRYRPSCASSGSRELAPRPGRPR